MRKIVKCDECDFKTTSKDSLIMHKETVHEVNWSKCAIMWFKI